MSPEWSACEAGLLAALAIVEKPVEAMPMEAATATPPCSTSRRVSPEPFVAPATRTSLRFDSSAMFKLLHVTTAATRPTATTFSLCP